MGRAILRASPSQPRLLSSVHRVPAPPLPCADFLGSPSCQRGWRNKMMKIGHQVGRAILRASPSQPRLLSSVHRVPAPPLPCADFLGSPSCQRGWLNKMMKIVDGEVPKRNQAPAGIHHPVRLGGHPSCPGGEPYNWDFQGREGCRYGVLKTKLPPFCRKARIFREEFGPGLFFLEQIFIDGGGGLASLRNGPDHQRLAAAHVAG